MDYTLVTYINEVHHIYEQWLMMKRGYVTVFP